MAVRALTWMQVVLVSILAACSDAPQIDVTVVYPDTWHPTELQLVAREKDSRIAPTSRVRIEAPAEWLNTELALRVTAWQGDMRLGSGTSTVQVTEHTAVTITLAGPHCGDWCYVGAQACRGMGVATCESGPDGCPRWSNVAACEPGTTCSAGACTSQCVDECIAGTTRCEGPGHVATCGQADGDPCTEWQRATSCQASLVCAQGRCQTTCVNECAKGAARCEPEGRSVCDDRNQDGCTEWGPAERCASGVCANGACADACVDECQAGQCVADAYVACGQFDRDACMDQARAQPCATNDGCVRGTCTATGCQSTTTTCPPPPAATCSDAATKRSFAPGVCTPSGCYYPPTDTRCTDGSCDQGSCQMGCTEDCAVGEITELPSSDVLDAGSFDDDLYWLTTAGLNYWASGASTGGLIVPLELSQSGPFGFAVDATHEYITNGRKLLRKRKGQRELETLVDNGARIGAVALDARFIYWSEDGTIYRRTKLLSRPEFVAWGWANRILVVDRMMYGSTNERVFAQSLDGGPTKTIASLLQYSGYRKQRIPMAVADNRLYYVTERGLYEYDSLESRRLADAHGYGTGLIVHQRNVLWSASSLNVNDLSGGLFRWHRDTGATTEFSSVAANGVAATATEVVWPQEAWTDEAASRRYHALLAVSLCGCDL